MKRKIGKLSQSIQVISLLPIILFSIVITIPASNWFSNTMINELENELSGYAHNLESLYNYRYPGTLRMENDTSVAIYKGDANITYDYSIINLFKDNTGCDATLFFMDTRIHTTLTDDSGAAIIGTGAPDTIIEDVYTADSPAFYKKTNMNGQNYVLYYLPLHDDTGAVCGMIGVGRNRDNTDRLISKTVFPLAVCCFILALIIGLFIRLYFVKVMATLDTLRDFLKDMSFGNLNSELDSSVLSRPDELGDIGRSIINMQHALRDIFEKDALTKLDNRRSCTRKLENIMSKSAKENIPFCVAIGDIDFFKKVNDTYGHDCGDIVLKAVADKLRHHMKSCGFVARWGGEEFLLVFDHFCGAEGKDSLEKLLEDIRDMSVPYENEIIKITMTFGISDGNTSDIVTLVRQADEKLYFGKENGRNQVVL